MQKRCGYCFNLYEDSYNVCPSCGYSDGDKVGEAYILKPGTGLHNNKYVVGQCVGQGGFGIIYKAWDTNLQRMVAIKEFYPTKLVTRGEGQTEVVVFSSRREVDYKKSLNKFRREAKIMSLFTDSSNCIKTYDVFEENGTAYIVMEYCNAPTLKSYVKERNGELLPEKEVVSIISQVLNGVQELHSKGVYHLDIALDNIFIKKDPQSGEFSVTIYDFGAAQMEQGHRLSMEEDEIILKQGFAPPEQYKQNGKIGPWTDIYAVGANLYYLLTGVVPIESTDREQADADDEVDPLQEPAMLNVVSPALNNATMRAMAVNPELRYQSANEFLEELKKDEVRSLADELKRRKKKRNRIIAVALVIFLLAGAAIGVWGYRKGDVKETDLSVWVVSDIDVLGEKARYAEIMTGFAEHYPQVTVNLEVMTSQELNQRFLDAKKNERPDLLETTYASKQVLDECESIKNVLKDNQKDYVNALAEEIISANTKQIPLGFYATVIYKQPNVELSDLKPVSSMEFLSDATGYIEEDTTAYSIVQRSIAGRYEVVPSNHKEVTLTEKFSIYSKGWNREKAAKALIDYMLTDSGQEKLHITNRSNYMPISQSMFDLYVGEVFGELSFLQNTLDEYEVK